MSKFSLKKVCGYRVGEELYWDRGAAEAELERRVDEVVEDAENAFVTGELCTGDHISHGEAIDEVASSYDDSPLPPKIKARMMRATKAAYKHMNRVCEEDFE